MDVIRLQKPASLHGSSYHETNSDYPETAACVRMMGAATNVPAYLVLPLLSGFIYVVGALFLKTAAELGANVWRSALICNLMTALVFAPLAFFGGKIPSFNLLWQPALVALFFVLGQIFTLLSLRIGDVSIATPVLAVKIILVAFLTTVLIGEAISVPLWTAAILSTVAVGLLQFSGASSHRNVSLTILLSGLGATCYALVDVHVQKWSPAWGFGRFLPITMGFAALFSLGFYPAARKPVSESAPYPTLWVMGGALCLALQAILLVSTIAVYGQATLANVLYSSRGLWSVVAVWLVGKWFNNREHYHGARVFAWRLSGAALLMTAIVIVLVTGRRNSHRSGERATTSPEIGFLALEWTGRDSPVPQGRKIIAHRFIGGLRLKAITHFNSCDSASISSPTNFQNSSVILKTSALPTKPAVLPERIFASSPPRSIVSSAQRTNR